MREIDLELLRASNDGRLAAVELLLENGADVNAKDKKGWTALKLATHQGHKEIVELLKSYGAKE